MQAYQQSLAIREMLVRLNPEDSVAHADLGGTLNNIGFLLANKRRYADALVMYRRAAEHGEAAFARAPQVVENGRVLTIELANIAFNERLLGHANEALAAYRRVVEVTQKLARDNPAIPSLHGDLFLAYWNLAQYQRELKQTEPYQRTMRLARETIERLPDDWPQVLFDAARVRAEYSTFLGQSGSQSTAPDRAEQQHEADLAVETLRKAVAAGFRDLEQLRTAEELNPLRGREDFKLLEADLVARLVTGPARLRASQQALALRQKLTQADPKSKRLRADLAAAQQAMALIQFDLGKLDEARKHLEQAAALREGLVKDEPKNAQYEADLAASRLTLESVILLVRAHRLVESGQTDKAAADIRKAMEFLGNRALPSRPAESETDKLFARLADDVLLQRLTAALERGPEDMPRRWQRGEWYARHARWKEAAADFRIALECQPPDDALQWLHVAPALAAGDREGYRWLCREMRKRFAETQDPPTADRVAKSCLLLAEFAKEMEWACALADRAVTLGKDHQYAHYFVFCKGLADYRQGNFRAAVEGLDSLASRTTFAPLRALCHPVLAMALHRQRQTKVARENLAQATRLLDQHLGDPSRFPLENTAYSHDWLIAWLLHREAQTLIEGTKVELKE
jgi:tetratricopeptide (TPR) repeat protein